MKETPGKKNFMREKIVRPPADKRCIIKHVLWVLLSAVLFGVVAAVAFVVSRPVAERYFGEKPAEESVPMITIEQDPEPDTAGESESGEEETSAEGMQIEEIRLEMEEIAEEAVSKYQWSPENIAGYQRAIQDICEEANHGVVTVSSIREGTDWFDNPVESAGRYAGIIIAINPSEAAILTTADVVDEADSLTVTFEDGNLAHGELKQKDSIGNMAVVSVLTADIPDDTMSRIKALELANSYMTRAGDIVIAIGSPCGYVHSVSQGTVSYVAEKVHAIDGQTRMFYLNFGCDADRMTFLLNLSGQVIGWASAGNDVAEQTGTQGITAVASISEYKGVLQKLTNGIEAPYFGVKGQDVSEAMQERGIPRGVYITDAIAEGPAYKAGIQNGDILASLDGREISTLRELKGCVEAYTAGQAVKAVILRQNVDEYSEIEYEVVIGAR